MTIAVPSFERKAMRLGLQIVGVYLLIAIGGLLFVNLLHAILNCRTTTGIDLSCNLFGIEVGSPLVPLGTAVTFILYAWPLVALATSISLGLAAVFWLRRRITVRDGT